MEDHSVVDVGDVRMAYRSWGDQHGAPVILLHGIGSSAASWEKAGQALGEEWRVYALDLRGHGESDWPDEYALEQMRDDVLGFIEESTIDRAAVVGHGMGGVVAYLLAQDHPDRVERLVLEETPAPFADAEDVLPPDGPVDYDENAIPEIQAQLADPPPDWLERLGDIVAPTLLVTGGPDSEMDQSRLPEMADRIPDCTQVTLPGGHRIHERSAQQFADRVSDFFSS
ncbi:alpha/beta fold hydrolase [Streptomyces sp. NPDC004111]|uniref:alpha/beta fold hydrolase n=1 Tax=Streptomyces sp. NPDC004111 TaxID=3364690 RepID=UPI003699D168